MSDEAWIGRCLELAARARGQTSPNPLVGCVIVDKKGRVVGEGYHRRAGTPHAEAIALAAAGSRARGATLYVSLEPCSHVRRRRTNPCAPLVLAAGIGRVVIGMLDPIRAHSGGARWLEAHGIEVVRNVRRAECREQNRVFVTWATAHRPYFVLKAAATLDGRIATRSGESRWITGPEARRDGHRLRAELDAILVGVGTVLADDPQLTCRSGGRDPLRVVVDSRLRTPVAARLLPANSRSKARVIIATTERAAAARERRLEQKGAEVWRLPELEGRVKLAALAGRLAAAEMTSCLAEGGGELLASLIAAELADEVHLYLAPLALGGRGARQGRGWLGGAGVDELAVAPRFSLAGPPERLGEDLKLVYRRSRRRPSGD